MKLGLTLSLSRPSAGEPTPVFDPATLALTGFWRDYPGVTWTGTASAGTSGSNDVGGINAPPTGTALDGFGTADFNGIAHSLVGDAATTFFDVNNGSAWMLFKSDTAPSAGGNPFDDPSMYGLTASGFIGAAINASGLRAWLHDGGSYIDVDVAEGTPSGVWHLGQVRWNGTNLSARIDGGSWSSVLAGPVGDLSATFQMGGFFTPFNGLIAEMGAIDTHLSDETFDNVLSYIRNRYPSAGV